MIINKMYGENGSLRKQISGWIGVVVVLIALSATIATAVPFQKGDVFAAVGNSEVKHYNSSGTLLEILNTGTGNDTTEGENSSTAGMAFDKNGNLYVTGYRTQTVSVFNNSGVLQGTFGSGYNLNPESIVLDAMGNIYVGQSDGTKEILKFDMAGNLLAKFTPLTGPRGTDWIDLAADQKTMFYTSEGGSIMRFDVSNNTQLSNFTDGLAAPCYALRIRPNGEVMVACESQAYLLNATGGIMQTYSSSGEKWFALNLDPDGTSFWTGDSNSVQLLFSPKGNAHKIDIANGTTLMTITTSSDSPINFLDGLAVYGEPTVATPPTVHITANPPTHDINVSTNFTFTANPVGSWGNNISYSWSVTYERCIEADFVLTGQTISRYLDVACGNATISVIAEDEKNNRANDTYLVTVHENVPPQPIPTPTFNISGFKINNATGSGVQGWNITLVNSTMQKSMLTGVDGSYKFMNLVNGTYSVTEETQAGWTSVSPISQQVTINGADVMNINFMNQPITPISTYTISGTVFIDSNQDKVQDNGEQGFSGATITLNTGQSVTTNADGKYIFSNLPSGTYVEALTVPDGYKATTQNLVNIELNGNAIQNFGIVQTREEQPEGPSPEEIRQQIIDEIRDSVCESVIEVPNGVVWCKVGGILIEAGRLGIFNPPNLTPGQPPVEPSAPGNVKLNPAAGAAGKTQVTATGSNWPAGHTIHVLWDGGVEKAKTTVDPNGKFSTTFVVPQGGDARIGPHSILFWDEQGGAIKEAIFTVTSSTL